MFASTLFVAASALLTLVGAQNYTTSGPLNVTASQIPLSLREIWCGAQRTSCPEICGGQAFPNNCNPTDLTYQCTCTNGAKPNISDYTQTLPFYVCQQWVVNCVDNHPNNYVGIQACRSVTCGTKNASAVGAGGSSSSSAASASGTASAMSSASAASSSAASSSSTKSKNFAAATHIAEQYGTQLLAGGMLAVFGLAL